MLILGLASVEGVLRKQPAARTPMARWVEIVSAAQWNDITDARRTFPTADAIRGTNLTCFNIAGNKYRLLAVVRYVRQEIEVRELLTHAQYSRKHTR